jgi:DNA-binding Xre family transcriptional regulator
MTRIDMIKIGKAVRRQRKFLLRKKQIDIAKEYHVSNKTIGQLERGQLKDIRLSTLEKIASFVGWSVIQLLQAAEREVTHKTKEG